MSRPPQYILLLHGKAMSSTRLYSDSLLQSPGAFQMVGASSMKSRDRAPLNTNIAAFLMMTKDKVIF